MLHSARKRRHRPGCSVLAVKALPVSIGKWYECKHEMTTYVVHGTNYNDPSFWASISEGSPGHTLDFTGLPPNYEININAEAKTISIWDGTSWYSVGESGNTGTNATLGSPTLVDDFTVILANNSDDYIEGSDNNDSLTGGTGNDTLSGDQGDDTLRGGDGDDYLTGGEGNDNIDGGTGNDTIRGDNAWTNTSSGASGASTTPTTLTVTNSADGPIELWWIDETGTAQYYATLQPGDTRSQSTFEEHNWILRHPDGWYLEYIEGAPNQTVNFGSAGLNDTVYAGAGNDLIDGMYGDDLLYGEGNNDTIYGDYGSDTIYGGAGDDLLYGGDGDDTLAGGTGSDTMYGGAGNDSMVGFDDADTFILEDGFGNDTIVGGEGGTDDDFVDLSNLTSGVTVTYTGDEAGTITDGSNTAEFSEIERIRLTDQADVLDASASLVGVDVDAGAGADTLTGSAGDDSLTGGTGDDRFVMTTSGGTDTVGDFDLGDADLDGFYNDQIDVSGLSGGSGAGGLVTRADVVVTDDGSGNALLTFPNGEQLVLQGVAPAQISSYQQLYAAGIPCFTPGIRIATARGAIPVEHIRKGDLLQTADNGFQPVIWTGRRDLSAAELRARPHLAPLRLRPGGPLANDRPLLVSPQHRFMLGRARLGDMDHLHEAFVRTRLLQSLAPEDVTPCRPAAGVSYIHLMTEAHQVIFAEGVATETFWPGPEALRGLSEGDRRELFDLFPELFLAGGLCGGTGRHFVARAYCPLARVDLKRRDLRALGARSAA